MKQLSFEVLVESWDRWNTSQLLLYNKHVDVSACWSTFILLCDNWVMLL